MAKLISLKKIKVTSPPLQFSKIELGKILGAYSNGVIKNYWRDYALDQNEQVSIFSIFKNSRESSTFCIIKNNKPGKSNAKFILQYRSKIIETSSNLDLLLKRLKSLPRLVRN